MVTHTKLLQASQNFFIPSLQFSVALSFLLLILNDLLIFTPHSIAQLVGNQAEMSRLEQQADELIANGDPNGAALSIGKAAMMAGILVKEESDEKMKALLTGIEALFRTQENGYRAIALFEQAGGQPPAPNGACQLLGLANQRSTIAQNIFSNILSSGHSESTRTTQRYSSQSQEWIEILQELHTDFACS